LSYQPTKGTAGQKERLAHVKFTTVDVGDEKDGNTKIR
jgi:hypothetical protein